MRDISQAAGKPAPDWPRAGSGILLAGIAAFLLLNSTGALPWSFWLDAIALWPLLVMSFGVRIAFEKSRAPWLVLLGPVFILGGLAWLASGARPGLPSGPWEPEVASRPAGIERVELGATLVGARLRVVAAGDLPADRLVDGRSLRRRPRARLETEADGAVARVQIEGGSRHGSFFFLPRPREHWDLRLPGELPMRVLVRGVGIGTHLDLTAGAFLGAQTEGVFIGADMRLPAPRQDTEIRVKGVFSSLTVAVPEGTPVRVHGPSLPFNALDRGVRGTQGRPGYNVHLEGIFSAVAVEVDRSISSEPPPTPASPSPARALPE